MKELIKFISEARRRGFSDVEIKEPLIKQGWSIKKIEEAFSKLNKETRDKVCIYLDTDLLDALNKRAKKNYFNLPEQIEDILRRSCLNLKKNKTSEKLDDTLLTIFSRKSR